MAHIAILIPSLKGGGAERTVLRTAGGLARRGHRVDIVLFTPTVAYPGEVPRSARSIVLCGRAEWERRSRSDMPVGVLWRPERASLFRLVGLVAGLLREFPAAAPLLLRRAALGRALRLARYFERERPEVVLANLPQAEYAAFYAARLVSAPPRIVPVMRNTEKPCTTRARRRRLLFPAAAHIVAISRGVAENVATVEGVSDRRITVIYNPAVAPEIVQRAAGVPDHPWFRDDGLPVVLGVGRLVPQKDFSTLIKAFCHVRVERPCRLIILGEGPKRQELESQVNALCLNDVVSLPGWTENPYSFMIHAELLVLSSRHEGFPGVLIEALACGCPVVSTDCPAGPSEILEDPSVLAPVGNPDALAQVILRAFERPADKAALRAKAARFSLEKAVDGYDKLVTALLAKTNRSG